MLELNTNLLAEIGGWPALKEARALVERGRVYGARREGAVIRAKVQGGEKFYDAQLTLAERVSKVEVSCTCIESKRSGRVCAHVLAAGLALLQPGSRRPPGDGAATEPLLGITAATTERPSPGGRRLPSGPKRWLAGEAPAGTPQIELTVLLPVQLMEAFANDPVRFILEARRTDEAESRPWDALFRNLGNGFAVGEEDERLLAALEEIAGSFGSLNAVPRAKMGQMLRALADHPRIWLGKKQRVAVRATAERPKISLSTRADGALELKVVANERIGQIGLISPMGPMNKLPLAGWSFDGQQISETATLPAGFASETRVIPRAQIPDFLSREFSGLERACELVFAPGFDEFQMEIGQPTIEVRLEGALSGLTLELIAHYGDREFPINGKTAPAEYQRYVPDPRQPNRFWRRNIIAEREAMARAESAGFSLVRSGTATFSLSHENEVARFLANTLPRWRRDWTVRFGARLEETMRQVDVAQPEFSLRTSSGEDWLSLDLKLSVPGKPVPLDPAEIHRWLQTGQNHVRTPGQRVLLVPTEAWSEMREVLADCAVDQEPGRMRVERTYAPFLTGALAAQGFRATHNVAADVPAPDVKAALDEKLWTQLRPYQAHGVEWLAGLAQQNLHGLLADDMGLGKTLQALAFCAWLKAGEVSHEGLQRAERGNGGETIIRPDSRRLPDEPGH